MANQKETTKVHVVAIFAGIVAIILLWREIWELSAKLFSSETSLILGAVIIIVIAAIEKRPIYKFLGGNERPLHLT